MVMDVLARHKGLLAKIDDTTQHLTKPKSQNFRDDLENSSAARDEPIFLNCFRSRMLRDKSNQSTIYGTVDFLFHKKFPNSCYNIMFDNTPR
jgi:hypothetical protein